MLCAHIALFLDHPQFWSLASFLVSISHFCVPLAHASSCDSSWFFCLITLHDNEPAGKVLCSLLSLSTLTLPVCPTKEEFLFSCILAGDKLVTLMGSFLLAEHVQSPGFEPQSHKNQNRPLKIKHDYVMIMYGWWWCTPLISQH